MCFLISCLLKKLLKTHKKHNIFCCVLQQKHIRKPPDFLDEGAKYCVFFMQVRFCLKVVLKSWDRSILDTAISFYETLTVRCLFDQMSIIPSFKTAVNCILCSWLCFWHSCPDSEGTILKQTISHMKGPILSFLEPDKEGYGMIMKAPRLLPIKSILSRKSRAWHPPKMMTHPLLSIKILHATPKGSCEWV